MCQECKTGFKDDYDEVYKILLQEVIAKKVYFKNQNLCKYDVLNGLCRNKKCCKYDHPDSLFSFFTGLNDPNIGVSNRENELCWRRQIKDIR